ncbi:MAG: HPP family protein [Verrucomicrobiota bacterium]
MFTLFGSENLVIVASLGSTAFVVFSMPSRVVASLKNAVCGHMWGVVAGIVSYWLASLFPGSDTPFFALSVSVAFLGMVLTDTDHPPAAGTALGVAISGIDWLNACEVIAAAALISGSKGPLRWFLRDLR